MATEKYSNSASTTLNGAIDNSTISVIVTSATNFPTTGQFRIIVESEIMLVTSVSGTTFTVTRGAESTTAASHADTTTVTHILTKGMLDQVIADNVGAGAFASIPASEKAGKLYLGELNLHRDSGSAFLPYGPMFPFTMPVNGDFAWINQTTNSDVTTTYGSVYLYSQDQTNGEQCVIRKKAVPTAPYTVTIAFIPNFNPSSGSVVVNGGLVLRESSSGKLAALTLINRGLGKYQYNANKWNSPTSFSATTSSGDVTPLGPVVWMRVVDDNTNRIWKVSGDGQNFIKFYSETRTNFITPNEIGFYINNYGTSGAGFESGINVLHWKQE